MLGLRVFQTTNLIQNMISNFEYLIDKSVTFRTAIALIFLGRSQPPFFSLMIKLISEERRKHQQGWQGT